MGDELERGEDNLYGEMVRAKANGSAPLTVGSERSRSLRNIRVLTVPSGMMEERGRGGVVQDFQTRGSDPAKQVISGRVSGNESVPGWIMSIEVSKDKSVRGVWKDVRREGLGTRIRRSASDRRGVEVKEYYCREEWLEKLTLTQMSKLCPCLPELLPDWHCDHHQHLFFQN